MASKKRILVIGSGASGLTSIKACKEGDLDVVCYEKTGYIGGVWHYHDDTVYGVPSVMKSTVTNVSKEMYSFSDFPAPAHFPMYLHHYQTLEYLEMYAEHFDLRSCIMFFHEVTKLIPAQDYETSGKWSVTVNDINGSRDREEEFDGVIICVGNNSYPSTPVFPGLDMYAGTVLHSHEYKTFTGMEDKTVLVVGAGNSGADVAVDLSHCAKKVYLSSRKGTWIFPRTMEKGKPYCDTVLRRINEMYPSCILTSKMEKYLDSRIDHALFGIKPNHRATNQTPTVNDELPVKIFTGKVIMKKNVNRFTEGGVVFDGETEETPVDAVLFATGYYIKFPFLPEEILNIKEDNKLSLFKYVFLPELQHPTLAIIGIIMPIAGVFPTSEMQARWFVHVFNGKSRLPHKKEMWQDIRKAENFVAANYVESPRHTVEVKWIPYMDTLADSIGAKPNLAQLFFRDPKLYWACVKGPCLSYQYRLNGPNSWAGARDAILNYKERLYNYAVNQNQEGANLK